VLFKLVAFSLTAGAAIFAQEQQLQPIDTSKLSIRAQGVIANAFKADDYPYLARQRGEEGRVSFKFRTGIDGNITYCEITESSGSDILDAVTCPILKARGHLTPARDLPGNPAPDLLTGSIVWKR
jgi:TonB family protein